MSDCIHGFSEWKGEQLDTIRRVFQKTGCPSCLAEKVAELEAEINTKAAANMRYWERIQAAIEVYASRKKQVEGFANKTASDMYAALEGEI